MAISIKTTNPIVLFIAATVISTDIFIWSQIFSAGSFLGFSFDNTASATIPREYFFDVGQGDSELVIFPGNITVMVDAGSSDAIVGDLEKVLPSGDRYIDLGIISEPQLADFNGYHFMLDHYRVGAFLYNGREPESDWSAWDELRAKIKAKGIPLVTVGRGNQIHIGDSEIDILSPNSTFAQSAAMSDTGLVELVRTPEFSTLLTADIGRNVEDWLVANGGANPTGLRADVLKIPDHGSSDALDDVFLEAVAPKLAVIEVGAKNSAHDSASSTLDQIKSSSNVLVLRTDNNGTVEIYLQDQRLNIIKSK